MTPRIIRDARPLVDGTESRLGPRDSTASAEVDPDTKLELILGAPPWLRGFLDAESQVRRDEEIRDHRVDHVLGVPFLDQGFQAHAASPGEAGAALRAHLHEKLAQLRFERIDHVGIGELADLSRTEGVIVNTFFLQNIHPFALRRDNTDHEAAREKLLGLSIQLGASLEKGHGGGLAVAGQGNRRRTGDRLGDGEAIGNHDEVTGKNEVPARPLLS
ncbi:hypothetical protein BN874_1670006 [Candidatus Contendobacter odensis Run_B_J11]|uniref:Uncharacterized protein n=1 Tax=Candidatus Contendobacter odensis Run_B_J11 TaxID=1400861 RepID=A0A7U7J3J7_9GAMM|nr:hypothetical protein BN874_1670006 [Candidatus Contendobacter odensis Run_B_J11]